MKLAIYGGTFDPVTNGHLDVLYRAARLFDKVIIAVAPNAGKNPLFTLEERMELIHESVRGSEQILVETFDGLLVDYARIRGAVALIRGLRAVSDFEYEFQMTQMNRELQPEMETIFFMPSQEYTFTSSTIVKQVALFDPGRVAKYVPLHVAAAMNKRFGHS
ncbi:MAG TPA: pantetheine-phosphate adenylyltransferase [Opitutales bacterium]|nr:pantetheine-phosphate adenylyltransferase [Opitutales bacterium]